MSQIDFFLCKDERIELAKTIFSLELIMIPDLAYEVMKPVILKDIEHYKKYVDVNELMFIVDSKAELKKFVFESYFKDGSERYYIRQRYGMPTIDFLYGGLVEKSEMKITPGSISNYSFYYSDGGDKIYPSEQDKHLYSTIVTFIKKNTIPVKLTKRTFWVGKKSIELCKQHNYQLININDKNLIDLLTS